MNEQQQIRDELRPILGKLNDLLFSFDDNQPILRELYGDLHTVLNKYVEIYNRCGFRAFGDEPQYTDCIDSL